MLGISRATLTQYLDELLKPKNFKDCCPNGLQVEGCDKITSIVCAVTANQALLDLAVSNKVDAILVHHGLFWNTDDNSITGIKKNRLKTLICSDINLYAYHLPLDVHPQLGNNAGLARAAGWSQLGIFGKQELGCWGCPIDTSFITIGDLVKKLEKVVNRPPFVLTESMKKPIYKLAWCTGAAQSYFKAAIDIGADAFITGEISEFAVHLARETGVAYLAAGHHATERFGVQALGQAVTERFGISVSYLEINSPI